MKKNEVVVYRIKLRRIYVHVTLLNMLYHYYVAMPYLLYPVLRESLLLHNKQQEQL